MEPGPGVEYRQFEGLPDGKVLADLLRLHELVFGAGEADRMLREARNRHRLLTLVALAGQQVVGYKIGYERKPGHFYSWVGAVAPGFRRRGIASELMRRQHAWCREQGYGTIRTATKNKWRDMLILNLRHGFDIIGVYVDQRGEPKLILEKRLPR